MSDEGNGNRQKSCDNNFETSPFDEESSSFSDNSIYSFESLVASYDMEAGYEEMQLGTDKIEFFVFFTIILRHLKWVLTELQYTGYHNIGCGVSSSGIQIKMKQIQRKLILKKKLME